MGWGRGGSANRSAKVTGTIVSQGKGKKIHGFTYIKVKNHQRHYGHRQQITRVRIDKIEA